MLDIPSKPRAATLAAAMPAGAASPDELAVQVESLTALHELAMHLGGICELQPALQAILDTAVQAQGADFGLVWLHEPESGTLVPHASRGFSDESLVSFARIMPGPAGGSAGNAFARRCRWSVEDTEADPAMAPLRDAVRRAGVRAVHSTPIFTRAGDLLGVLSVHYRSPHAPTQRDMQMADVCARYAADSIGAYRSQEALRRSERTYRAIGESLDYGVWNADREGRITYHSECFLKLIDMAAEACADSGWMRAVHPDDVERMQAQWSDCVREGRNWDCEFRVRGADGGWHAILGRAVQVRGERGEIVGWTGINLDIERLKSVEHELRELNQRKNEFLATLAHELRDPLAPLRNGLEVLRLAGGGGEMGEKARTMMERQLGQMVRLVDDLLDMSRVNRGKIELRRCEVELAEVLRNAIETSQPLMNECGHRFEASIPAASILVDADTTRLAQVFSNLLNNAAKYTPNGGHIALDVRALDGEVAVTVRDNGPGIPAEMLTRIFDIFTQVDRCLGKTHGGLGIGLSIAKRLTQMHGGTISVASAGEGQGSEFTVRLPAKVQAQPAPVAPGRRRILVADDNEDAAVMLAMLLEAFGNEVCVAHDGSQAVEMAASFRPDAVLLDIGMPKMNGYEACRAIRGQAAGASAVIIALTGWGSEDDKERARAAGFDRHLVKPVDPQSLEEMVRDLPAPSR